MIRCERCEGPLRMRATGVWVHVDRDGNALPGETVWPRDHEPKPTRSYTIPLNRPLGPNDVLRIETVNGRVTDAKVVSKQVEIEWGDGLEFDRAWWDRKWEARR